MCTQNVEVSPRELKVQFWVKYRFLAINDDTQESRNTTRCGPFYALIHHDMLIHKATTEFKIKQHPARFVWKHSENGEVCKGAHVYNSRKMKHEVYDHISKRSEEAEHILMKFTIERDISKIMEQTHVSHEVITKIS